MSRHTKSRTDREYSKFKKFGDLVDPESSVVQVAIVEGGSGGGGGEIDNTVIENIVDVGSGNGHSSKNVLVGGVYMTEEVPLLNGDQSELRLNLMGALKVEVQNTQPDILLDHGASFNSEICNPNGLNLVDSGVGYWHFVAFP